MPIKKLSSASIFTAFLRRNGSRTLLAAASSLALMTSAAHAATITWTGTTSTAWTTAGNWTGSVTPGASDVAEFNSGFTNAPVVGANTTAGGIWATTGLTGNLTIGGSSFTLTLSGNQTINGNTNTAILLDDSNNHSLTVSPAITLSNSSSFIVSNTGTLSVAAVAIGANTLTLNATNVAGTIAVGGIISGTGGVVVNTTGTVSLTGANSFTGGLQVQSGTVTSSNNFGGTTGTITLGASGGNNATILSTLNGTVSSPILVNGASTGTLSILGQTNNPTFSGSLTLNNNLTVDNLTATHVSTFSGVTTGTSTGATITKGTGAGAVNFTGTIVPGAGGLTFVNSGSTGSLTIGSVWTSTGSVTLDANSTANIGMSSALTGANAQTLTNNGSGTGTVLFTGSTGTNLTFVQNSSTSETSYTSGVAGSFAALKVQNGTFLINSNLSATAPVTISSTGTFATSSTATLTQAEAITDNGTILAQGAVNLNGLISGSGSLTINAGAGNNVNLGSTAANTINSFTGTTTVLSGTLTPAYVGTIGASTGSITNGSNSFTIASTTGTFLATGDVMYANSYFGTGTITGISTSGSLTTITLNTTANTGTLSPNAAIAAVFTLGNDSLGAQSSTVVLNGGTLAFPVSASEDTTRLFELGPNGGDVDNSNAGSTSSIWFLNTNAITYTTPNVTETLTLSGNHVIGNHPLNGNGNLAWYSLLDPQLTDNGSGALTLVKNGVGIWVVENPNNSYSGGTIINGGVLQSQTPGSLGSGPVTIASSGTLVLNVGGFTYSNGDTEYQSGDLNNFFSNLASTGTVQAGATIMFDPTDLAGTSGAAPAGYSASGTFNYSSNINLTNINFGRTSDTGNQFNYADLVLSGNISLGTGGFYLIGNSATSFTELGGNNSFTGAVVLNGGTNSAYPDAALVLGSTNALGSGANSASKIIVESSTAIAVDPGQFSSLSTSPYVVSTPISFQLAPGAGAGLIVQLQIGTTLLSSPALSNAITFTGTVVGSNPITGDSGVGFLLGNSTTATTTFSGPIYINDGTSSAASSIEDFDIQSNSGMLKFTGAIADAAPSSLGGGQGGIGYLGSIGQTGGTLSLQGANTYTGPTTVFRGILQGLTFGNYGTATASSFGSPTTAATGVLGIYSGADIQDIGTTNETSNRSVSLINGNGILDYSGTGTLNITGTITSAVSLTAGTHTMTLQGSTAGMGEVSGVIADAPTSTTLTTYLAQGSGSTTLTILNAASFTGTGLNISGTGVTGTISKVADTTVTLGTATTGSVTAGETLTVSGGAAIATAITKTGTGTWELAGVANTYSGATTINGGTLQVMKLANEGSGGGTASSIGASSNAATNLVINGGTLQYVGSGDTTDRNFQLGANNGSIDASGTGSLVLTGTVTGSVANSGRILTLTGTNTGLNTMSGSIVDNGSGALTMIKNGVGTWVLSGANSYAGSTTINGGILSVSTLSNAGVTYSLSTTAGSATITLASGTTGSLTVGQSITGNANIPDGSTIASIIDSTHFTIASGTGITAGTVTTTVGTASGLGIATGGAGNLVINGGTLQYTGTATSTNRGYSIGVNGGTIDASGTGAVDFTGGIAVTSTNTQRTLTLTGTNTGTNTIAGVLVDDTGTATTLQTSLIKTGVGTWYLTGANTFTGGVTVANGVLGINTVAALGSAQSLGKGTGTVTLGSAGLSSGTLLYTGATGTLNQSVTSTGIGGDTIQNGGTGLLTIGGAVSKNGTTLTLNGGAGGIKVTGVISGAGGNSDLDVTSGTTTLSTAATYNGATWVYGGGTLVNGVTGGALPTNTVLNIGTPGVAGVATSGTTTAGTFDLSANNQTVAGLNTEGTGPSYTNDIVTNNGSGTGTATLTVTGGGTFAGVIQNGATAKTAVSDTGGVLALSGSNTYSGGTSVTSGGTLLVSNTGSGSATGSGSLGVTGSGSTIGGYGRSSSTSFNIAGTGTATGSRANVLVGMNSASDTNTSQVLTLLGAATSTITNANLTFNISGTTAGALNGNPAGSGTELAVAGTSVSFGTSVASVSLTLNVQNEPAVISAYTPYVLIAGTGVTTDTGGVSGGQYTGLTLGTVTNISPGVTETIITGNNLQLAFSGATDQNYYAANSYLVLYQDSLNGIDDIDVVVVPEPGTWALMLSGLGLLIFWQRRKNS
jgi:fibronectin-binding autotransporter adhesin